VLAERATLEEIQRRIDEGGGHSPFAPAVDLGLRFSPVMEQWLRDQLEALPDADA